MSTKTKAADFTIKVSDSYPRLDEHCNYEVPFRRWLVREIEECRLTISQAIERFNFNPKNGDSLLRHWRKKYAPEMVLSLPGMTAQEKQKLTALQKQLKALEQQLDESRMRNIALNTLIDVAEEKLKISIRKKPGAKQ
jgi:transposase-like protein